MTIEALAARLSELEDHVASLETRLARQETQNIGNVRIGPQPIQDNTDWVEEGNKLAEAIIAKAKEQQPAAEAAPKP